MRRIILSLLASTTLASGAQAATMSQAVQTVNTGGTAGNYTFDFTPLLSTQAAAGYDLEFTGATISYSGYSNEVYRSRRYLYDYDTTGRYSCGWSSCTYTRDNNVYRQGDHQGDTARVHYNSTTLLNENTWGTNAYSETYINVDNSGSQRRRDWTRTYSNYGSVSASAVMAAAALTDLNDDGMLDFSTWFHGDGFQSLNVSLSVDYTLSQSAAVVPLPASFLLLSSVLGAGALVGHRRRRKRDDRKPQEA